MMTEIHWHVETDVRPYKLMCSASSAVGEAPSSGSMVDTIEFPTSYYLVGKLALRHWHV